jgi:tetratricopeptide (TPR) repeat protein
MDRGGNATAWILIGALLGVALVFGLSMLMSELAGDAAGRLHTPSGASTPVKRGYSRAEALVAGGHYAEAALVYEVAVAEDPEDAEPYIRLARLFRDAMDQPEEAASWFKRARHEASIGTRQELVVTQELIELYLHKAGSPQRALPELARLIDRFPESPAAAAARAELAQLRRTVVQDPAPPVAPPTLEGNNPPPGGYS